MEQNQQNGQDIADSQAASAEARVRLMNELKSSIDAAEGWLQQGDESDGAGAASSTSDSAARQQFNATLQTARTDLQQLQQSLKARSRSVARSTDAYIHENPWKSVGIGAAVGLAVGLLITRK